jgi:glutathione peroxidase
MKRLKRILIIFAILLAAFAIYVEIVNINSRNMTYRQKVLKAVYPALMWWTKLTGKNTKKLSNQKTMPPVSFYSLKGVLNNGDTLDFASLKGKKVLLVNTASDCGYTDQYTDLQKLYEENTGKLVVIGFPANDFKEQEKGSDEEIAQFCKLNYGVSFPLMKKSVVIKSNEQNSIYKWLTDAKQNGWNEEQPSWNFSKYLISEDGVLLNYFGPSVSPTSSPVIDALK